MDTERTEEQIVLQQVTFRLAGEDHTVRVKSIREMAGFRKELGKMVARHAGDIFSQYKPESGNEKENVLSVLLSSFLGEGIDDLMNLPALYAPELKEVADKSTDEELLSAGAEVLELVFPLVAALIPIARRMIATAKTMGLVAV